MRLKPLDIIIGILLVIGGLNWGLVGFFNYNLIGSLLGSTSIYSRILYALVGLSALYEIFQWRASHCRICSP